MKELQNLVEPEQQRLFSFYERINHTPLDDIGDIELRREIAKAIVESELIALFENGVYDPDGHPGNWPIDVENREIVRIDYAQLRAIPEEERVAFRKVFSELIKPAPNFSSRRMARLF